jgi:hypothetical protein
MSAAKLKLHAPVLLTHDLPKGIKYWNDQVGFESRNIVGEPPHFAILGRNDCFLMLKQAPEGHIIVPHWKVSEGIWNVYFWVDDARAMFDELKGRGAKIDYELCEQPYRVLEFGIQDIDGHDIGFGQELEPTLARERAH